MKSVGPKVGLRWTGLSGVNDNVTGQVAEATSGKKAAAESQRRGLVIIFFQELIFPLVLI